MNSAIVARRRNAVVTMQALETDEDHGPATFLRNICCSLRKPVHGKTRTIHEAQGQKDQVNHKAVDAYNARCRRAHCSWQGRLKKRHKMHMVNQLGAMLGQLTVMLSQLTAMLGPLAVMLRQLAVMLRTFQDKAACKRRACVCI